MSSKVTFLFSGERHVFELPEDATLSDAVSRLGLHVDSCIILDNGKPVPEEKPVEDGKTYEVVAVASGG